MPDSSHPDPDELIRAFERTTPLRSAPDSAPGSRMADGFHVESEHDDLPEHAAAPAAKAARRERPDEAERAAPAARKRSRLPALLLAICLLAAAGGLIFYLRPGLPKRSVFTDALRPYWAAALARVAPPPTPAAAPPRAAPVPAPIAAPPPPPRELELLDHRLAALAAEVGELTAAIGSVRGDLAQTRQDLADRIGQHDSKFGAFDAHLLADAQALASLDQRLAVLEAPRRKPVEPPSRRSPAGAHANPRAAHQQVVTAKAMELPPQAPVPAGFALRGVSRNAALVQTPTGLLQVEMGDDIPGLGLAQALRRDGETWVLVTSGGVIRE
jgi:hypothetical protein